MIAHIFNPTVEILIPIGMSTSETNVEIQTQPLAEEMERGKWPK